ncbi:MAG: hypothetical protein LAT61_15065 [Alcanivorax sp.]|nr:hypothetical protein [Alcanivorax sp.]
MKAGKFAVLACLTASMSFYAQAHAGAATHDEFESTIITTLITKYNIDPKITCLLRACREERAQDILARILDEAALQSAYCETEAKTFSFIDDMKEYSSETILDSPPHSISGRFFEENEYFLNCQDLVQKYHADEIQARASRQAPEADDSIRAALQRNTDAVNRMAVRGYIQETCQPVVTLRNCMVDKHPEARQLHDTLSAPGRRGHWRNYQDTYEVRM